MRIVERGEGTPLVFVPGLQGRWEYARATVDALAAHFRVVTFSLGHHRSAGRQSAMDSFGDQIAAAMDRARFDDAIVCGLSFGGLVALNFAARNPERLRALVLASTPGPGMKLRQRHEIYLRLPWLFGPVFMLEAPLRARRELSAAIPDPLERLAFARTVLQTLVTAPVSPARMAARARLISSFDAAAACERISVPTLIVTGEPHLDYVVNVHDTSRYARLIPGARSAVLERTGHQGTLTRPHAFAEIVQHFVKATLDAAA